MQTKIFKNQSDNAAAAPIVSTAEGSAWTNCQTQGGNSQLFSILAYVHLRFYLLACRYAFKLPGNALINININAREKLTFVSSH